MAVGFEFTQPGAYLKAHSVLHSVGLIHRLDEEERQIRLASKFKGCTHMTIVIKGMNVWKGCLAHTGRLQNI